MAFYIIIIYVFYRYQRSSPAVFNYTMHGTSIPCTLHTSFHILTNNKKNDENFSLHFFLPVSGRTRYRCMFLSNELILMLHRPLSVGQCSAMILRMCDYSKLFQTLHSEAKMWSFIPTFIPFIWTDHSIDFKRAQLVREHLRHFPIPTWICAVCTKWKTFRIGNERANISSQLIAIIYTSHIFQFYAVHHAQRVRRYHLESTIRGQQTTESQSKILNKQSINKTCDQKQQQQTTRKTI